MCSHLYVHNNLYLDPITEGGKLVIQEQLTLEAMKAVTRRLRRLQAHINREHETKIPGLERLSIRDIVDGLAIYLSLRSGNSDITADQIRAGLKGKTSRLWQAYDCAEYWLGGQAWDLFPLAAAFALSCSRPVMAYLEALREIGRHDGDWLLGLNARGSAQALAVWTGHETIDVGEAAVLAPPARLIETRLNRLKARLESDVDLARRIGPYLHRKIESEVIQEIMPQFARQAGGGMRVQLPDKELAQFIPTIEICRGLFEGLAGLETTMLCTREECPFHQFRICGRVVTIRRRP
jgi:hypothetical protein